VGVFPPGELAVWVTGQPFYQMTKKFILALILCWPMFLSAQHTTVTAQVQDSSGTFYINCTGSASFVGQNSSPGAGPYLLGGSVFQTVLPFNCDASGNMKLSVPDNNQISPNPSQWRFSICSTTGYVGGMLCFNTLVTITGTTQDITSNLSAVAPILTVSGGGNVNLSSPPKIGNVTPNTGAFTATTLKSLNSAILFADRYTDVQTAISSSDCPATGCVVDARSSNVNLALAAIDPGTKAITLLLGPYGYTFTQITLRPNFHIYGQASGAPTSGTYLTSIASAATPGIVIPQGNGLAANYVDMADIRFIGQAGSTADGFDANCTNAGFTNYGLWYSTFRRLTFTGWGHYSLRLRCHPNDASAANQFLTFQDIQLYRPNTSGSRSLSVEGYAGQIIFDNVETDGASTGTGTNIYLGTTGTFGPTGANFRQNTNQGGAVGVQIGGATNITFDTTYWGATQIPYLITQDGSLVNGSTGINIIHQYFDGGSGINAGSGALLQVSTTLANVNFCENNYGNPDNVIIGTQQAWVNTANCGDFSSVSKNKTTNITQTTFLPAATIDIKNYHTVSLSNSATSITTINSSLLPGDIVTFTVGAGSAQFAAGGNISLGSVSSPLVVNSGDSVMFMESDGLGGSLKWQLVSGSTPVVVGGNTFNSVGVGTGYQDVTEIAIPGNPAAGNERLFTSSSTHLSSCLTSSGANCAPAGMTSSGSPTNHQLPIFTTSTNIKGFTVGTDQSVVGVTGADPAARENPKADICSYHSCSSPGTGDFGADLATIIAAYGSGVTVDLSGLSKFGPAIVYALTDPFAGLSASSQIKLIGGCSLEIRMSTTWHWPSAGAPQVDGCGKNSSADGNDTTAGLGLTFSPCADVGGCGPSNYANFPYSLVTPTAGVAVAVGPPAPAPTIYPTGTATFTNGSANVTGSGTTWTAAMVGSWMIPTCTKVDAGTGCGTASGYVSGPINPVMQNTATGNCVGYVMSVNSTTSITLSKSINIANSQGGTCALPLASGGGGGSGQPLHYILVEPNAVVMHWVASEGVGINPWVNSFGSSYHKVNLDLEGMPNGIGWYTTNSQENFIVQESTVSINSQNQGGGTGFCALTGGTCDPLAAGMCDASYQTSGIPKACVHSSWEDFRVHKNTGTNNVGYGFVDQCWDQVDAAGGYGLGTGTFLTIDGHSGSKLKDGIYIDGCGGGIFQVSAFENIGTNAVELGATQSTSVAITGDVHLANITSGVSGVLFGPGATTGNSVAHASSLTTGVKLINDPNNPCLGTTTCTVIAPGVMNGYWQPSLFQGGGTWAANVLDIGGPLYQDTKALGTVGATKTINPADGNYQTMTLTSATNLTISFTQTVSTNTSIRIKITQVPSGTPATVTWTGVKWAGGGIPPMSSGFGAVDWYTCVLDGTNVYCAVVGQAFS